ncbi:hypothetical protein BGZ63DRAFT_424828 [Mariannaea sp. PMI_226]|nr:hypothetical protein BGZ63DRAFT_424828 [Mariannaea sp. PMI_226]
MDARELRELAAKATVLMAEAASLASINLSINTNTRTNARAKYQLRVLGPLSGRLMEVHCHLQNPTPGQEEKISRRLPVLLKQLEAVSAWPSKPIPKTPGSTHPFPFLDELVCQASPNLNSEILKIKLSHAMAEFVSSGGDKVGNFLSHLQKLVPRKYAKEPSNEKISHNVIESPDEYPEDVNKALYSTLSQHFQCRCHAAIESCSPLEHWARLRLGASVPVTEDQVMFDMLFSAAPSIHCLNETIWQHLRFQVPRHGRFQVPRSKHFKSVRFGDQQPTKELEKYKIIQLGEFCALLGRPLGSVCVRLKIIDGGLRQLFKADMTDQRVVHAKSVSLSDILARSRISSKAKLFLAYVLAKSVWRYYNSDFMKTPWTTESVHFMREGRRDDARSEEINPASPCFAFSTLMSEKLEPPEYCDGYSVLHRYPRVLALGVLLVDICRKCPLDSLERAPIIEQQLNDDFTRCADIIDDHSWPDLDLRNEDAISTYRDAVRKCLDPKLFHVPELAEKGLDQMGMKKRRDALYTYVVLPLETLCTDLAIIDKIDQIGKLSYSEPIAELVSPPGPVLLTTSYNSLNSSNGWLKSIMESPLVDQVSKQYRKNRVLVRPRIAILDTGYDANSQFFAAGPRRNRLIMWKDFVDGQAEPVDSDGHGTHVVSLCMKIAPAADICVARIAKDTDDLQNAAENIEQAIAWATGREEANADIVSMSFGFPEEPHVKGRTVISNAIYNAIRNRDSQVLFFAAAANDGGNQREMFPARHSEVFSIRATDHQGVFQDFNPAPNFQEPPSFGTLGTEVPGASLNSQVQEAYKTGTSTATPIAAGTAATILGYVHSGISTENSRMEILRTRRGMYEVFMKLSMQISDKHMYLRLQEFLKEGKEQRDALLTEAARLASI